MLCFRSKLVGINARLNRQEKYIKENKIPVPYKSRYVCDKFTSSYLGGQSYLIKFIYRITGPSGIWKVFYKQSEAFAFTKSHGKVRNLSILFTYMYIMCIFLYAYQYMLIGSVGICL